MLYNFKCVQEIKHSIQLVDFVVKYNYHNDWFFFYPENSQLCTICPDLHWTLQLPASKHITNVRLFSFGTC